MYFSSVDVLKRIDALTASIIYALDEYNDSILMPVCKVCPSFQPSLDEDCDMDDDLNEEGNGNEDDVISTTMTTNKQKERQTVCERSLCSTSTVRGFTSSLLVLSFVQNLLLSGRTTTNREVYYCYVTHFRNQKECDSAITDVSNLLQVPRISMGLCASPRGWFSGLLQVSRRIYGNTSLNPTTTSTTTSGSEQGQQQQQQQQPDYMIQDASIPPTIQGFPITREWIDLAAAFMTPNLDHSIRLLSDFKITSDAKCIIVVEKEGIFTRLNEDKFYDLFPCILITSKGFPDLATRAMTFLLYQVFQIPVYGLCDCNPFGIAVLQTFYHGSEKRGVDGGDRYRVPIQWAGLRPSHVDLLKSHLPAQVFQQLTPRDIQRLAKLSQEDSLFLLNRDNADLRCEELKLMMESGYKLELEALHSLGMNYLSAYLEDILLTHDSREPGDDPAIL